MQFEGLGGIGDNRPGGRENQEQGLTAQNSAQPLTVDSQTEESSWFR